MRPLFALVATLPLWATTALAQVPQTLHHQGRIASGGINFDGPGQFKFLLYATKTSGSVIGPIWKNDDSSPSTMVEPAAVVSTTVTKGLYSIALGESPQAPLTGDLLQPVILLRIWFNDGVNGFQQLAPDRRIASVPFAVHADRASTVVDGSITAASLDPTLQIPNVQSGIHQTAIAPPWISSPLPYAVTFPNAFTAPPVVTVSPGVDSRSPVYGVSATGFSGSVEVPPDTWSSTIESVFSSTRPSVFEVDGRPALVYGDGAAPALRFSINSSADGGGTWEIYSILSVVPETYSPAVIDGRPAIAYTVGGVLQFAINSAIDGSGTWSTSTVDFATSLEIKREALALVDGRPPIAYYDSTSLDLRFAINSLAGGSGTWTLTTVDFVDNTGKEPSLALVDGRPAIAYIDSSEFQLRFAINSTSDGSGSWVISTVRPGSPSNTFHSPSMAILDGKPAIASLSRLGNPVNVSRQWFFVNSVADGSGTWAQSLIGEPDGTLPTSMAVVDGVPAVAFREAGQLNLAVDPSGTGSGPWSVTTIDDSGANPSVAAIGNRPMIAFHTGSRADFWRPQQVDIQWIAVGQ